MFKILNLLSNISIVSEDAFVNFQEMIIAPQLYEFSNCIINSNFVMQCKVNVAS